MLFQCTFGTPKNVYDINSGNGTIQNYVSMSIEEFAVSKLASSVIRSGDLLDFGQLFKAFGSN